MLLLGRAGDGWLRKVPLGFGPEIDVDPAGAGAHSDAPHRRR